MKLHHAKIYSNIENQVLWAGFFTFLNGQLVREKNKEQQ